MENANFSWPGIVMAFFVLLLSSIFFACHLAFWKASVFQTSFMIVLLLFGLISPVIQIAAMWAVMGCRKLMHRQFLSLFALMLFFGISCGLATLVLWQLDLATINSTVGDMAAGRSPGMRMEVPFSEHVAATPFDSAVLEIFLAVPVLFLIFQVPVVILALFQTRRVGDNSDSRQMATRDLFLMTLLLAIAFACLAVAKDNPVLDGSKRVAMLKSMVCLLAYACISFALVFRPCMVLFLEEDSAVQRRYAFLASPITWACFLGFVVLVYTTFWSYRFSRSILWLIAPLMLLLFPTALLFMQVRRLGFRIQDGKLRRILSI